MGVVRSALDLSFLRISIFVKSSRMLHADVLSMLISLAICSGVSSFSRAFSTSINVL